MRVALCLLAASCLAWSPLLMSAAERASVHAEQLGFALGSVMLVHSVPAAVELGPVPGPLHLSPEELAAEQPVADPLVAERPSHDAVPAPAGKASGAPKALGRGGARTPGVSSAKAAAIPPKRGLRVRESTVLRWAQARAVPEGSYVAAGAEHPGGMLLRGVARYGVGLQEGDVLTSVQGVPANSRAAVVSAVMQARAARAPAIVATFFRAGEPWRLIVEMPYLERGAALEGARLAGDGAPPRRDSPVPAQVTN